MRMTIKELIEELKKYPEDARIISTEYHGYSNDKLCIDYDDKTNKLYIEGDDIYENNPWEYTDYEEIRKLEQKETCNT